MSDTANTLRFYLYGTYCEGSDTLRSSSFSFTVDHFIDLEVPSFLIWFHRDSDVTATLCKIRRTSKPADIGMKVEVFDAVKFRLISHGLLESVFPDSRQEIGMSARESASEMILMRDIWSVPDDKSLLVKNAVLKNNASMVDETYFLPQERTTDSELLVQASDALHTAFRIFGIPSHEIPNLLEQQILDFDIETIFADSKKLHASPDGKHYYEHNGKRLYLHKVDRTLIERALGVDLIYNYFDEKRLVFVQYKCQSAKNGRYYPSSDSSHEGEIKRMEAIPGLADCPNRSNNEENSLRLCRCPVFIKLCKREIADTHTIPVGVHFPLCVWKWLTGRSKAVSTGDEPHLNNKHFQELVRMGLIGSTPQQSMEIEQHLIQRANEPRLKLIFEERRTEPA